MKSALHEHVGWLRQAGVAGIVALGSTGEFPRFSVDQRKEIVGAVVNAADSLPVIVNISDIRPAAVAELGRFAHDIGAAGVAIMPPYFYPLSQPDLLDFFLQAADAAKLPVLLYNFPELAGTRISLETIESFAARAPMAGIKQSGREFPYHAALIELGKRKDFVVYSGADTRLPEVFRMGAAGCIGGMVNFVPEMMVSIHRLCNAGHFADTDLLAHRMKEAGAIIDRLTFPLNVAAAMEARGFDPGAPKTIVSSASAELYKDVVKDLRAAFQQWEISAFKSALGPSTQR